MDSNAIIEKSENFALRIVKMYQFLNTAKNEHILSKQLLKSGTSIGANVIEAVRGQSKADFYAKLNIALKEAAETSYWLRLLYKSEIIDQKSYESIYADCDEIIKILVSITKNQKDKQKEKNK